MKLFKFTCGDDEKIGAFPDARAAQDRCTEIDPTFSFLPVKIEELTVPGYVIELKPIASGLPPDEGESESFDDMDADKLRTWLDARSIKYHSQFGEKKLRDLCIASAATT